MLSPCRDEVEVPPLHRTLASQRCLVGMAESWFCHQLEGNAIPQDESGLSQGDVFRMYSTLPNKCELQSVIQRAVSDKYT